MVPCGQAMVSVGQRRSGALHREGDHRLSCGFRDLLFIKPEARVPSASLPVGGTWGLGGEAYPLQPLGHALLSRTVAWSGPGRWTAALAPLPMAPQLSVWYPGVQRPPQLSHAVTRARGAPEGEMGLAPHERITVVAGSGLPQNSVSSSGACLLSLFPAPTSLLLSRAPFGKRKVGP